MNIKQGIDTSNMGMTSIKEYLEKVRIKIAVEYSPILQFLKPTGSFISHFRINNGI